MKQVSHPFPFFSIMLSQLKSREHATSPAETSREEFSVTEKSSTNNEVDQQAAAARMTCDALCSLANGPIPRSTTPPTASFAHTVPVGLPGQPILVHGFLSQSPVSPVAVPPSVKVSSPKATSPTPDSTAKASTTKTKACPKQHQLPLFLSKTYHMIDRCDREIATWSATGDNFVVKNVEKFASAVLPMYFKHSNFSSFARQLNFYGFRKLRSDPILTNDVDPQTAAYVRFYHEKFQKDRPELLHSIKRATKSDQQSKDDVDDLKSEVFKLKKCVLDMSAQMERKISEMNFEYNRRISGLTAEYDKLAGLVAQLLQQHHNQQQLPIDQAQICHPPSSNQIHHAPNPPLPPVVETTTVIPNTICATTSVSTDGSGGLATGTDSSLSSNTTTITTPPLTGISISPGQQEQKMQSLSQVVAMSLMGNGPIASSACSSASVTVSSTIPPSIGVSEATTKRAAPESVVGSGQLPPPAVRPRTN